MASTVARVMGTALARGRGDDALRIARGLSWFWFRRGYAPEGRIWLDRVIQAGCDELHGHLPRALLGLASLQYLEGDLPGADANLDRAVQLAAGLGDTRTRVRSLVTLAYMRAAEGELEAGELAAKVALDRRDPVTASERVGLSIRLMRAEGGPDLHPRRSPHHGRCRRPGHCAKYGCHAGRLIASRYLYDVGMPPYRPVSMQAVATLAVRVGSLRSRPTRAPGPSR